MLVKDPVVKSSVCYGHTHTNDALKVSESTESVETVGCNTEE